MFSKRKKMIFPPGTFIPTAARIVVILQLCLAFTLITWNFGQPFMGKLFDIQSKMLPFKYVMGITSEKVSQEAFSTFENNAKRFELLPKKQKETIIKQYQSLEKASNVSFLAKLKQSFYTLCVETSPFTLAWIFFSTMISILLLKRSDGALQAVWLLPLIVAIYAFDNTVNGIPQSLSDDEKMFPSESLIINNYLKEPLSVNIFEQKDQLLKGWHLYLIDHWAKESPSIHTEIFQQQIEKGNYAFQLARAENTSFKSVDSLTFNRQKEPSIYLLMYFGWNLFFAWFTNNQIRKERKAIIHVEVT